MEAIAPDCVSDARDRAYVLDHFVKLEAACRSAGRDFQRTLREIALGRLPGPAYVLDEIPYVPSDYFFAEFDRERFIARYTAACRMLGLRCTPAEAEETWGQFLTGIYGVCLRNVTPENIARKHAAIAQIDGLISVPRPHDSQWIARLQEAVDDLDALERPFSPVFDRRRFGRPPTRDSHVNSIRDRFLR
jgi:hypothetical protein